MARRVVVVGEYNPTWETHRFTNAAIEHAQRALNISMEVTWCSTQEITRSILESASGFWIATGTPYQSMANTLDVIRYAREHDVPCLGTCQGFQHIMLEYAQSFLGLDNPGHAEYERNSEKPFIAELSCSLKGQVTEVAILEDSRVCAIYGATRTTEKYYCSYGINPGSIRISGVDAAGEIRIVEYPQHPFLIGTLFVPQARSQAENPHPLITAFVKASVGIG